MLISLLGAIPVLVIFIFLGVYQSSNLTSEQFTSAVGYKNISTSYVGAVVVVMVVYLIIYAFSVPTAMFNYSLRLGGTRGQYFFLSTAFYVILSTTFSVIHTVLLLLENIIFKQLGIGQSNDYSFIFSKLNVIGCIRLTIFYFLIFGSILCFVTFISCFAYRLGEYGWVIIMGVLFFPMGWFLIAIILTIPTIKISDVNMDILNIFIILISLTLNYIIIRGMELKKV